MSIRCSIDVAASDRAAPGSGDGWPLEIPPFVNRAWDSLRTTRCAGPTRPATKEAEVPTAAQFGLWALTFGFAFALSIHEIYAERRGWEMRP